MHQMEYAKAKEMISHLESSKRKGLKLGQTGEWLKLPHINFLK